MLPLFPDPRSGIRLPTPNDEPAEREMRSFAEVGLSAIPNKSSPSGNSLFPPHLNDPQKGLTTRHPGCTFTVAKCGGEQSRKHEAGKRRRGWRASAGLVGVLPRATRNASSPVNAYFRPPGPSVSLFGNHRAPRLRWFACTPLNMDTVTLSQGGFERRGQGQGPKAGLALLTAGRGIHHMNENRAGATQEAPIDDSEEGTE